MDTLSFALVHPLPRLLQRREYCSRREAHTGVASIVDNLSERAKRLDRIASL